MEQLTLWQQFHTALTFLTRFGRARITSASQIAESLSMYPAVGAFIGSMLLLGAQLPGNLWVKSWLLCILNIYITRALHWDGWADLWDGWGSGAQGDRFWEIVKDSHIGAFGTIGLIIGIGLQASLYEAALAQQAWPVLLWSCMFGRCCCLLLAKVARLNQRPGLGQNVLQGATPKALLIGCIITCIPLPYLTVTHVLSSTLLGTAALTTLYRLGRDRGGINGDFLGASIIAGELSALLPLAF